MHVQETSFHVLTQRCCNLCPACSLPLTLHVISSSVQVLLIQVISGFLPPHMVAWVLPQSWMLIWSQEPTDFSIAASQAPGTYWGPIKDTEGRYI